MRKGWSFSDPDHIDQCVAEGWSERSRSEPGGVSHLGQVCTSTRWSAASISRLGSVSSAQHAHPRPRSLLSGTGVEHHDFGHIIHEFSFGSEQEFHGLTSARSARSRPSWVSRIRWRVSERRPRRASSCSSTSSRWSSTEFRPLSGEPQKTQQYSVTTYERDLSPGANAAEMAGLSTEGLGAHVSHGFAGVPGVFFNYEISPLKTIHSEYRQSLSHF